MRNISYKQSECSALSSFFWNLFRIALTTLIMGVFLISQNTWSAQVDPAQPLVPSTPEIAQYTIEDIVIKAAKMVEPAVVNVNTTRLVGSFFYDPVPQKGQASGVIFRKDGYILTNEHVIHEAKEIKVILNNGKEFAGKLIGADSYTDLAVVKIEAKDLPAVKLGDSDELRIGQWAIAVGNPFGLQNTVTVGVISATKRSIRAGPSKFLKDLIQTDAAINPGNSGGPLVNTKGEVIGINTALIPYAQGIGFAIPINTAKEIVDQLIKEGKVIRPWIGVYYLSITPDIATRFKLPVKSGIYVVEVAPDGPAEKAGVIKGDIIKQLDGQELKTTEDLKNSILKKKIGEQVFLTILRNEEAKIIKATIGGMP